MKVRNIKWRKRTFETKVNGIEKRKKRQRLFKYVIEGCAEKFSINDELKKHQKSRKMQKEALFKCTKCANIYQTIGRVKAAS